MKWYHVIILLTAALLFSSCAVFKPSKELEIIPAERAAEVRDLLAALQSKNNTLKNFKGIGKIKVWQNGIIQVDQRVAWIGERPVKLSIAVLISGYPAIKLATDGQWLYYLETRGHDTIFKKIAASDPSLKNIISIPIKSSDIVMLLAGGIPLREFDAVDLIEDNTGDGYVLVLKKRWWGLRQKIYLDENGFQVRQIEVFDHSDGSMKYRAEIENMRSVNGYQVPFRLKLSTGEGADFLLDIDRYWVNVELPTSVFVLAPPK
jgi:outer membrane lipoprotein-sorting protein